MTYKVTKQYGKGAETHCGQFRDITLAREFVREKLREDAALKVKVTYRINEWDEMIEEFDSEKINISVPAEGSQGQGKGATFRPTPLNPAPRPAGIPHNWVKDEDDKQKDD